ncbi:MAG TPA: glycosyltransferase, partial [Vicinamibacterales bacterium]
MVAADARSFAVTVNRAVALAAGAFIVVAPASAEPAPGWLETLLDTAESAPRIDAVTSKLVGPAGALAAAGSVLWRDGTCEPFGRGDLPTWHEHEFRRDVPAGPPAYLLIRRQALKDCGGFDEGFTSAEYAAAELCLRFREARRRIVYQPRVTIRAAHLTPASSIQALEATADRDRLAARHAAALTSFPPRPLVPTTRHRLAARDALCSDRMLIVDDRVPGADRGSGDPRMLRLVMEIAALWPDLRLTLAAQRAIEPERYAPALRDAGVEVLFGCPDWTAWFVERRFHYGAVMVSKPQPIDPLIRRTQPQAFRIYDAEAFVFRRLERTLPFIEDQTRAREVANQLRGVRIAEAEYLASADLIVCVSQEERRAARAIAERVPSIVIPHQVDVLDAPAGYGGRNGLIYFGGFMAGGGSPNEDALIHLVSDVLPLLHAQEPELVLYVVGADPTPTVLALESERIRIVGYVPDPTVWLSRTRVH